jgi:hypothetical protein
MLRGLTHRQFQEWRHYSDLEPFDEERADARSAQVVQAIYNVQRKRGAPPVNLEDCLLRFGPDPDRTAEPAKARAQVRGALGMLKAMQKAGKRAKASKRKGDR